MQLEILQQLPITSIANPPILFIHGAFSGAWCWQEYFLPYFAQQGYPAYAISLRGHGNSQGNTWLGFASIADYVADVLEVSRQWDKTPILVGHSMGGMVVQKYLEAHHPARAAILMASVPPQGLWASSSYLAFTDPWLFWQLNLIQYVSLQFATPLALRKALFSNNMSQEMVDKYLSLMQGESHRAILDMLWLNLPRSRLKPQIPVQVLGAENDAFFPPSLVEWTATAYETTPYIFPNMAHAMMLEPGWQQVADKILAWLNDEW
jgi:pimeloyl-ACP methyl ester carboxylesterase